MGNEINTGAMSNSNFTIEYQRNGYGGCIPVIDGKPEPALMFGYASETDKQACMNLIEKALRATKGNIRETMMYMMNAASVSANEITPDEVVEVEGEEFLISYKDKKAYEGITEIANLDDLNCELPNEAVKALLINRIQLELENRREEYYEDDYDDYDYE